MMADIRFKWNLAAFREIRTTPAAEADIARRAAALAAACGPGFEAEPLQAPRTRAHAVVATATEKAKVKNAREQTLLRNLGAAR